MATRLPDSGHITAHKFLSDGTRQSLLGDAAERLLTSAGPGARGAWPRSGFWMTADRRRKRHVRWQLSRGHYRFVVGFDRGIQQTKAVSRSGGLP
jgi:hypothetical protein